MPAPRVFISSTCYDLKYIRENLKFFVRTFGYEPVLSEEGSVFYDPRLHTQEACLTEVPSCQMLVLIIGGRFGGRYRNSEISITNEEYHAAVKAKIPVFALVERAVLDEYRVYRANVQNLAVDASTIRYPAVDSTKIFDFVEEVQSQVLNNSLVAFSDFEEMQAYLKQQWSSMMYRFLTSEGEARRTADILAVVSNANERIEFLTRRIVDSVGDPMTKITVELYDTLLTSRIVRGLALWDIKISPKDILKNKTLDEFCGGKIEVEPDEEGYSRWGGGPPYKVSQSQYEDDKNAYKRTRELMIQKLQEKNISVEKYLSSE